ncbi:hypothetical protein [Ochrobactrum sp. S1502_03]|uniref:hypothetical protein n=1 Tax=Ochrobactrum sp. S1502_03 TaxID=3108451 RepID=UPI0037C6AD89
MTSLALSRYLPDFSTYRIADDAIEIIEAPVSQAPLAVEKLDVEMSFNAERAEVSQILAFEEEKRLAFEAGREDGHKEAEALYAAEKARLLRAHDDEIEALRAAFSREQANLFAVSLTQALVLLEQNLSQQLAEILMPLYARKLQQDAVESFAERISTLALEGEAPEIYGPAHLLGSLRQHMDLLPSGCQFIENESGEVSFSFGERVLETRLAPLLEEIAETVR